MKKAGSFEPAFFSSCLMPQGIGLVVGGGEVASSFLSFMSLCMSSAFMSWPFISPLPILSDCAAGLEALP